MTHIQLRRLPLTLLAGAFLIFCSTPAGASFISSTVQSPQVNTGNAGQLVTVGTAGASFAEAVTNFAMNKTYATSDDVNTFMQATSDWGVTFTLSGNGLTDGTAVPLSIQYSYDATVTTSAATGHAGFSFRIGPNALGQNRDIFRARSDTFGSATLDQCETRFPLGGDHPSGACAGSFSDTGFVTDPVSVIGSNTLEVLLVSTVNAGTSDAFSTGRILSIIVPDGVDWTYAPDVTGNPLNFTHPSLSGVPEPSTWAFLATALGAMLAFRRVRRTS